MREVVPRNHLERIADRMEAAGTAEALLAQLELEEPLDRETFAAVMLKTCNHMLGIIDQCIQLERECAIASSSLSHEKKLNLDLRMNNRQLTERNAAFAKEVRNLKGSIEDFFK